MSIKDFLQFFDSMEICNISPAQFCEDETFGWHENHFEGTWIAGESAGGCRNFAETFATNPQFIITLEDSDDDDDDFCTCIISLMQKGSRKKKALGHTDGCLSIGKNILQGVPKILKYFLFQVSSSTDQSTLKNTNCLWTWTTFVTMPVAPDLKVSLI